MAKVNPGVAEKDKSAKNAPEEPGQQPETWPSEANRVPPPFRTRMIMHFEKEPFAKYDTYNKLLSVDRDPTLPENFRNIRTQSQKPHGLILRHMTWTLSTFVSLFLLAMEMVYMIIGFVHLHRCGFIDVYLVISAFFHVIIIVIEWLQRWIWKIKSHRDSRIRVDLFHFTSALALVVLYLFSIVWFCVGLAWIMVPYTESLFNLDGKEEITVIIRSTVTVFRQLFCSMTFYHCAIFYQVYTLVVFLIRLVMYGFSDFCRGLCYKLVTSNQDYNLINKNSMIEDNLYDFLPSISSIRSSRSHNLNSLLPRNIHRNLDCMVSNLPEWRTFNL